MFGKRLICSILCLVMVAALFGCAQNQPAANTPSAENTPTQPSVEETTPTVQTEPAPTEPEEVPQSYYDKEQSAWILLDRFGLDLLREHPSERFIVAAEIDCKGMVWEPIPEFSGSLSGLWGGTYNHTISNLTITGTENVGFFSTLSGTVADLNFADITVELPDSYSSNSGFLVAQCSGSVEDVAGYRVALDAAIDGGCVGAMFGTVSGTITDCYVDGALTAQLKGNAERIGGLAGSVESIVTALESRTDLTITASEGSSYVGGIAGQLQSDATGINYGGYLNAAGSEETYVGTLAGTLDGVVSQFYSNAKGLLLSGATNNDVFCGIAEETGAVADCYIRDVSSLDEMLPAAEYDLRKTVVDYMYAECTIPWTPSKNIREAGGSGQKYTQDYQVGVTYFGLPYTGICGSLERFISRLDENGTLSDQISSMGWEYEIGNDCADAVYWAWNRISPSVTYTLTNDMLCKNGTIQLGDYTLANYARTKDTCTSNPPEVMYESYAQVKMGDAMLLSPGHVMMAAEAAYVYRDADGNILPDISYILAHEQGSTMNTAQHFSTCSTYKKFSFTWFLENNYIPITIPEFAAGKAGEATVSCDNTEKTAKAMFEGTVTSNYRINWATAKLLNDATGEVLIESTIFPSSGSHNNTLPLSKLSKAIDTRTLLSGITYRFIVLIGVADGQEFTAKDYTFTLPAS